MRRFGIPQRLYAIIGLGGVGLVVGTAVFIGMLFHVSDTLGTLHTEMRQHDHTRLMQVAFTQQVREWKNILLRGHNPADLATYRASFTKESDLVRATGEELKRTVRDAKARELLDQFLDAHRAMGRTYDEALERFVAGRGLDPRAADTLVRGQDRVSADVLEQIVARIDVVSDVEAEVADIRREAIEVAAAIAGFLVLLIVGSSVISRSITQPIGKTMVALERVAAGDLRYRVSITGHDEVARMNRALNSTVEAIQRTHEQLSESVAAAEAGRQRLAILHEIDHAILAIHSPTTIAEIALRHLRGLVRAPRAVLALYDVTAGVGTFLAVDVEGRTARPAGTSFPLEMMGDLDALRRGVVQIVETPSLGHLPEGRLAAAEGIQSYAAVPLITEGQLIGSLNLCASEPGGPAAQDLVVAVEIAAQLAIALQQGRLYQEVKESRDMLEAVVESAPLAIVTTDVTGVVKTWNPAATHLFGWPPEEVLGRPLPTIPADGQAAFEAFLAGYQRGKPATGLEVTRRRKDGSLVDIVFSAAPILDVHGRPLGVLGVFADITQRKQLELQLRQAQKMDAIGQLAGGVAHDFNNLLTVIGGRSTLLLDKMRPDDPARKHVELIARTSERAAGLTRQLLAFSRKQVLELKPLDLNTLVAGVTPMLRRLIGEHIEVVVVQGSDVGHVMADAGQMEQVVMNLVVNARDAMAEGGMVKIETAGQAVQEPRLHSQGEVPPGQYVTLSVQDTGSGIDSVTLARIFEPFFTTKDPGKGTGLGLSTVHGIVHQSGGYIAVDSTLGRGTTFTILLPRIAAPVAVTNTPKDTPQDLMQGTETVLLVEDDEEVRRLGSEVLQVCGYTVVETGDPLEALTIGERRNGAIDLLVTDMVMPGMGGAELASRLEAMSPGLRVLCMSGYADQIAAVTTDHPARACLPKPFTPHDLAKKVREALTGASP
jgi:PAS domain S-box-containing protein